MKELSNLIVKTVPDLNKVMEMGQSNRSVAATDMNQGSSRSHSIFTITIESAESDADGEHIRVGETCDGLDEQGRHAIHVGSCC